MDPVKRENRIKNLVELFKICELLKHVVIDQINMPQMQEIELEERK